MSNADRLAGFLADYKKQSKSTSINIGGDGDDTSETQNLLGWAQSGFGKLKNQVQKVQENIPLPNPLKRNRDFIFFFYYIFTNIETINIYMKFYFIQ